MDITADQLVTRYGAKEIADVAVPNELVALTPEQMEQAATGADLSGWDAASRQAAEQALARIVAAIARAATELAFYLRHRPSTDAEPVWLADDAQELARYHLYDRAGREDSTIRLRYQDVIKRLKALADEDKANGAGEAAGTGAIEITSNPRRFSRRSLGKL